MTLARMRRVTNCIIWINNAALGPEIYNGTDGHPTFTNCDIRGCGESGPFWNPKQCIE